jgi:hypothetical protein
MATQCHTRVVAKLIAQHLLKRFLLLLLITRRPLAPPLRIFLPLLGSRRLRPCRCHRRRPTSGRLRLCGSCLRRRGCCCCCSCCGCCYGRFLLPCAILRPLDLQMALLAASCVDLTSQNACTRYPCGFLLRFSVAALSLSRQKPQHWPRQFWQFWQFCLRRGARRGGGGPHHTGEVWLSSGTCTCWAWRLVFQVFHQENRARRLSSVRCPELVWVIYRDFECKNQHAHKMAELFHTVVE